MTNMKKIKRNYIVKNVKDDVLQQTLNDFAAEGWILQAVINYSQYNKLIGLTELIYQIVMYIETTEIDDKKI